MRLRLSEEIRADHAEIRRLVAEGFDGVEHHDVDVEVVRAREARLSFTGLAFWELPPAAVRRGTAGVRFLVRLRLPATIRNRAYPKTYRYRGRKTAPWITVGDWRERLLALAAHEACHVRQFRHGLRRSEVEAERWAAARLEAWRAGESESAPTGPQPGELGQLRLPLTEGSPARLSRPGTAR